MIAINKSGTHPRAHIQDLLVRVLGWRATLLHSDSAVTDRWRFVRTHLQPGNLRTLDAGCGSGAFTIYAAKIGNRALGLSFDDENNKKAIRRAALLGLETIEFQNADLRELDCLATSIGKFDQIMCLECIEHIKNDQKLVRDLAALLKPAGILILTTPYKHHKAYYGEALSLAEDGGHVRRGYTHDELREMLAESDMTVVAVDFISGFVTQKLASLRLRSLALLPPTFVWAFTFLLRPLTVLDKPVSILLNYPYLAVGVVAMKASN